MRLSNLPIALTFAFVCLSCARNYNTQDFLDGKFLGDPAAYKKYPPLLLAPQTTTLSLSQSVTLKASGGSESGYVYSVISGKGSVTQAGVYTASDVPGAVLVEVKDSVGTNGHATISVNVDQKLPNTISGLRIWLKADAQSFSDLQAVNQINDSSGFGTNATTATADPTFRTNQYNGKPIIRYNGTSNYHTFAYTWTSTTTFFAVITQSAIASGGLVTGGTANFGPTIRLSNSGTPFTWYNDNTITVTDSVAFKSTAFTGLNIVGVMQSDSNLLQGYQNGELVFDRVPLVNMAGKTIVNLSGPSQRFGGDLAELIVYTRVLTNAEVYALQCGLAKKWGVTMANCQ